MEQIREDVAKALELIYKKTGSSICFTKYCGSFLFTTESQEGVQQVLSYQGKDVLTVASSGDQYLGAVYYGANTVDLYDINRLTYYITYLKIASIRVLGYHEFLHFFVPVHSINVEDKFWDLRTLKKVIPYLPKDVAYFWEHVMFEAKKQQFGRFVVPSNLYNHLCNVVRGMPFYEREKEYYKLQNLLKNREYPSFREIDLSCVGQAIEKPYDIVYLSNIIECMVRMELDSYFMPSYGSENRIEEEKVILICEQLLPFVRENGEIMLSYRSNSSLQRSTDLLYNNDFFEVHSIPAKILPYDESCFEAPDTDLVLTYCPSRTGNFLK